MEKLKQKFSKFLVQEYEKTNKIKLFSWTIKRLKQKNPQEYRKAVEEWDILNHGNDPIFFTKMKTVASNIFGEKLACGAFRCVWPVDKDMVIKIGSSEQNAIEANNKMITKFPNLFPKHFMAEENYLWLVVERVKPIEERNLFINIIGSVSYAQKFCEKHGINKFYAINIYQNFLMLAKELHVVRAHSKYQKGWTKQLARERGEEIKDSLPKTKTLENEDFQKLLLNMLQNMDDFTKRLVTAMQEFDITAAEIRPKNVGVTSDGKIVLVDASMGTYFIGRD